MLRFGSFFLRGVLPCHDETMAHCMYSETPSTVNEAKVACGEDMTDLRSVTSWPAAKVTESQQTGIVFGSLPWNVIESF